MLSFLRTKGWRLWYKDTRQCFVKTKRPAAFLATMAPQGIRRHAGHATEQVHLHPPDAETGFQSRLHFHQARHPPQPVTLPELNLLKSSMCRPDILIRIQLFPVWIFRRWWGYRAWYRFGSRYADWWRLVHSLWSGNAANIHFEDMSSRLSDSATDDEHWPKDRILEISIIYIYVLLKNNVVIKKNVNENARKAAKTTRMINCAKFNDCI